MQDFAYACPLTVEDAVVAMRPAGARALAGGTDLIPQMREGRRQVPCIVDLKRVPELTGILALADGGVAIGAAATASRVARHPFIAANYPAVARSARLIGSLQVQNRATLGGNICNAAPSADAVPALICHQARLHILGPNGPRDEQLEAFLRGPGKTALAPGEFVVSIGLPAVTPKSAAAYLRFTPRREMDIAIAGAAAWMRLSTEGRIAEARVVLASVGPTPLRAISAEQHLLGNRPDAALFEAAGKLAASDARPISDTRGSADYRRSLVAVLTQRALAECRDALQGQPA